MWLTTHILNILAIAIYFLIEYSAACNELDIKEVVIEETIIEDTDNTKIEE